MAKPKPIVVEQVCSICDLDWELHPDNPSSEDCVELLKKELDRPLPTTIITERCCHHHHWCNCWSYTWNPPYRITPTISDTPSYPGISWSGTTTETVIIN